MGTTLVGMILRGTTLWVVNVGDSRAYHITKQAIRRITRDHSVVEDLVAKGDLTPEQARNHPQKKFDHPGLGHRPPGESRSLSGNCGGGRLSPALL